MEQVARQTGSLPDLLRDEPDMPPFLEYLWSWWLRLTRRRGCGFAPEPLNHSQLADFFRLIGIDPQPWEIDLLERIDDLYLEAYGRSETNKSEDRT